MNTDTKLGLSSTTVRAEVPTTKEDYSFVRNPHDLRDHLRRNTKWELWILSMPSRAILRCITDNVSQDGLHATAPVGFGLAVGQRYEIRLSNSRLPKKSVDQVAPLGYGTVVRTEFQNSHSDCHRVGFAMRFDTPTVLECLEREELVQPQA